METVRLEGIEEAVDNGLLASDYLKYLKPETRLDHRITEEKKPSPGVNTKATAGALTAEEYCSEISVTAAKSTIPPPLSPSTFPSPDLSRPSSSNQEDAIAGSSSVDRLTSKQHSGERRSSKHKKDKVSSVVAPPRLC